MPADLYTGFISKMRKSGVAKTKNFFARINLGGNGSFFGPDQLRSMSIMCSSVELPEKKFSVNEYIPKGGYVQKIASYIEWNQILPMSFYCSPDMSEKIFFEKWANLVVDPISGDPNFYDEYARNNSVTVFQLTQPTAAGIVQEGYVDYQPFGEAAGFGSFQGFHNLLNTSGLQENSDYWGSSKSLYYVTFYECFPINIQAKEYSVDSEEIVKVEVDIAYSNFITSSDAETQRNSEPSSSSNFGIESVSSLLSGLNNQNPNYFGGGGNIFGG